MDQDKGAEISFSEKSGGTLITKRCRIVLGRISREFSLILFRSLILFKCPLWNGVWTNPGRGINNLNGTVVVQVSHREFLKFSLSIPRKIHIFSNDEDLILVCIIFAWRGLN